jgi:hypothetical protein
MALDDMNFNEPLADLLAAFSGKRPPSDRHKEQVKAAWIDAFINISQVYAETEIGTGIRVNVPAIALFVNSPDFINQECHDISDINCLYEYITDEILKGFPIYKFLKLSKWQYEIMDKQYKEDLEENENIIKNTYICKRCRWLREAYTSLGSTCKCKCKARSRDVYGFIHDQTPGYHDYTKIQECDYFEEQI